MAEKIKTIVLDGGPCSGKTTLLKSLMEEGSFCGYRLLFVPEAATVLSAHGLSFFDGEKPYQLAIASMQLAMESLYKRYAQDLPGNVAIICDRGTLDGAAYCGEQAFEEICDELEVTEEQLIKGYDYVLYLVSAAIGAEECYGTETNEERREGLAQAKELELATRACWDVHPKICVIDNEGGKTFDEKMTQAMRALEDMLAE